MKKYSAVIAMFLVLALAVPVFANPFTDVPANHWAYSAVNKLVASGIAEGYPDGSFRGKNNLTRYEIAIVVSRILDKIEMEREMLADDIDTAAKSLSKEEAQDVTAIVKAMLAKNQPGTGGPAPTNLTDQQVEEVVNLIEALTFEFKAELKILGQKIDGIYADVDAVEARVAALEAGPTVSFSGDYKVDFQYDAVDGADPKQDTDYYYLKYYNHTDPNALPAGAPTDAIEEVKKDEYVETDPWDGDSDDIVVDGDGKFSQTLTMNADINKDGLTAKVLVVAEDSDDNLDLDSAELGLENDEFGFTYNSSNKAALNDYAFNDQEFNGVSVNLKKYGVDTFLGTAKVKVDETNATVEKDVTYLNTEGNIELKKDVVKYEFKDGPDADTDADTYRPIKKDINRDFFVYGAETAMSMAGFDLKASVAGRQDINDEEEKYKDKAVNVLGLNAATDLDLAKVSADLAYSMPGEGDAATLIRLNATTELGLAAVEFNYKNSHKDFKPVFSDKVLFDSDNDDYDIFTTGVKPGTSGFNFTVTPNILEALEASVFYASVQNPDDKDNTKLALEGSMEAPILEGLIVKGKYEDQDKAGDKKTTTGFGAEYKLLADKATVTFDYTMDNEHEDKTPLVTAVAEEVQNTTELGASYELTDNISVDFNYENVANNGYMKSFGGEDLTKSTIGFGAELSEYPLVFAGLTARAGFDYETVTGYAYNYDKNEDMQDWDGDGKDIDHNGDPATIDLDTLDGSSTTIKGGLGYVLGAAKLDYDLAFTMKDKHDDAKDGVYMTHKLGLTYTIVEGTDLTAGYRILDMNYDNSDDKDYQVQTATAGVSVSF